MHSWEIGFKKWKQLSSNMQFTWLNNNKIIKHNECQTTCHSVCLEKKKKTEMAKETLKKHVNKLMCNIELINKSDIHKQVCNEVRN